MFFNAEFTAPWCLSEPQSDRLASLLALTPGHLILYHFLIEGRAFARLPSGMKEELTAGDVVVFPHGDAHLLGNGWPERPVDAVPTFSKYLEDRFKIVRFGSGGEATRLVCGYMLCNSNLSQMILAGLPKMIKIQLGDDESSKWLRDSIQFSAGDEGKSDASSEIVVAKLSEALFVETLRRYINGLPQNEVGWLAGARDTTIGKALALMHKEPSNPWTVSALAQSVGQSRTRFAERFRHFLKESPMAYLTRWRLKVAADMLLNTELSMAEVAMSVGYGSEASFNRAFKREFHQPPARFRRKRISANISR